jgi:putative phosphoesterase
MKIALISDIHGNYSALEAILKSSAYQSADKAYCLGDLVGYYPYPEDCVKRIKKERIPCVMGNHDHSLVKGKPCLKNQVGIKSFELTRKLVSSESISFLSKLPEKLELEATGKKLFLVHGSPSNPLNGYVNPDDDVKIPSGFDVLAMGHTHKPFAKKQGSNLVINPGSVGQPRNGVKGASFAVLDLPSMKTKFFNEQYKIEQVIMKTRKLGFEEAAKVLER